MIMNDEKWIDKSNNNTVQINKIKELLDENYLEYTSNNVKKLLGITKTNNLNAFCEKIKSNIIKNGERFRVALYIRLSVEDGDLQDNDVSRSIRNQLLMLLDECEKRNWLVVAIFCEEDITGADDNRPEWRNCLKFCENGNTEIVLCKSQSRFTRSLEMVEKYLHKEFVDWNIRFVGLVDNIDTSIKGNKKSRQIYALTNEWAIEDQSVNTRATLEKLKRNGQFTGSFAPYGYIKDPKDKYHLIIDEYAAKVVRMIFNMYKCGKGYHKICQMLNQKNIPTPAEYKKQQGLKYYCPHLQHNKIIEHKLETHENIESIAIKYGVSVELIRSKNNFDLNKIYPGMVIQIPLKAHWTRDTVRKILMDEIYIGTLVQGKVSGISYKNKKQIAIPREKWIRVPHCHEAIINQQTWKVISSRFMNHGKSRPSYDGNINIFCKKVYCSHCGKSFRKNIYKTKEGKKYYLQCKGRIMNGTSYCTNKSIGLSNFENFILNRINMKINEYYELSLVEKNYFDSKNSHSLTKELKILEMEKIKTGKNIERKQQLVSLLYEDRLLGIIDINEFSVIKNQNNTELTRLQERMLEIDKELSKLEEEMNHKNYSNLSEYRHLKSLNRVIIDEFINKIYIGPVDLNTDKREMIIYWNL